MTLKAVATDDPLSDTTTATETESTTDDHWITQTRDVRPTIAQARDILTRHNSWKGVLGWDTYHGAVAKRTASPWGGKGTAWTDVDTARAQCWFTEILHANISADVIRSAARIVADDNPFSSLADEITAFVWDGESRIDHWLTRYLGANSGPYEQAVGAAFLISAVARAISPGCQADYALVLEGETGTLKSSSICALASEPHYSSSPIDLASAFAPAQLLGVWLYELGELVLYRSFSSEVVDDFLSRRTDDYSPKHQKEKLRQRRSCVFVGTTTSRTYLPTANHRRSWPVRTGKINLDDLRRDRELLIAEAISRYRAGARWWLDSGTENLARCEQERRHQPDTWEEQISAWMAKERHEITLRGYVSTREVLTKALKIEPGKWGRRDEMRVGAVLESFGWRRGARMRDETMGRIYPYLTPQDEEQEIGG